MGKVQSKLALKRRQSPEGGSLSSNVLTCQGELERIHIHRSKLTQNLYVELRENKTDHNCNFKVVFPPKKAPDRDKSLHLQVNKQTKKKKSHENDTQCDMVLEEASQQEWVFTLYNFDSSDKATKEDMSSLIHSMYEVVEASVKQPCSDSTPLKIKLVVTPSASPDKISQTDTEKELRVPQKVGCPGKNLYCVDENIERRNHYLDLAGIENFTSKFDNTDSPYQEPRWHAPSALRHHTVLGRENCISSESPRSLPVLHSPQSKPTSAGKDRSRGEGKSCRLHGQHPASWCHPTQSHPPAHGVLQRAASKRLRPRVQDAPTTLRYPDSQVQPAGDRDLSNKLKPSCGARLVQRHKHHHHHEHHHHHHHHHYQLDSSSGGRSLGGQMN